MGKINYIRVSSVKALVKELGRRSGKEFIEELDKVVGIIVEKASGLESKKKTLEASVIQTIIDGMVSVVAEKEDNKADNG